MEPVHSDFASAQQAEEGADEQEQEEQAEAFLPPSPSDDQTPDDYYDAGPSWPQDNCSGQVPAFEYPEDQSDPVLVYVTVTWYCDEGVDCGSPSEQCPE